MSYSGIGFNELPLKAQLKIFHGLTQTERQMNRSICKSWNKTLLEEFPIELTITNDNYCRLFRCPIARKVTINSLTEEFTGQVAFAEAIRNLEITGKVLSSNLIRILQGCRHLEILVFSSLKQVLEIESNEVIGLPKVTLLEIKVRPDQETFTSDEMIIISTLKNIQFGSLQSILVSARSLAWDEDDDDFDGNSEGFGVDNSNDDILSLNVNAATSEQSTIASRVPNYPSLESQENPDIFNNRSSQFQPLQAQNASALISSNSANNQQDSPIVLGITSNTDLSATNNRPLVVEQSVGMDSSTSDSLNSINSMNENEFAGRLFNARMRMQIRNSGNDLDSFLYDPSRSEMRSNLNRLHNNTNRLALSTTVFFELMCNNSQNLKNFIVKTRPDFMCFGNISSFLNDVSKIQLEEIEYSFGRSQLCLEFTLLKVQSKIHRIRVHILDDMWDHLMTALDLSQKTVTDVDLKILSLSEDPINLQTLSRCKELKVLKLLHFFEKLSLNSLPNSLTKLVLNGPINCEDLSSFTVRLINLVDFTLILNNAGGKVDVNLFKRFVRMPKLSKLIFIQCLLDVNGISKYCESIPEITLDVEGPRELMSIPSIQYVMVVINSNFDRQATTES